MNTYIHITSPIPRHKYTYMPNHMTHTYIHIHHIHAYTHIYVYMYIMRTQRSKGPFFLLFESFKPLSNPTYLGTYILT